MFGIDSAELLVVALVALVVIGPKDLPNLMRQVGYWVGRARGMARHFRSGIDNMIRESELEEMEKKWREENERIMREHPIVPAENAPEYASGALPPPDELVGGGEEAAPPPPEAAEPLGDAPSAEAPRRDAPPPAGEALP